LNGRVDRKVNYFTTSAKIQNGRRYSQVALTTTTTTVTTTTTKIVTTIPVVNVFKAISQRDRVLRDITVAIPENDRGKFLTICHNSIPEKVAFIDGAVVMLILK
jgi:hypothetical protein